jgi:hypothetical protein
MTSEDSVTLTVTVIEAIELVPDGELFVGARVRACVDGQQSCNIEATTNDDGVALLTVPVSANAGFDGQIVVDGVVPLCP